MTPQQINIAVAECLGWQWRKGKVIPFGATEAPPIWYTPEGLGAKSGLPKFTESLDACAAFEKTLKEGKERVWYLQKLAQARLRAGEGGTIACMMDNLAFATPLQRCEAFLRLKGRWV